MVAPQQGATYGDQLDLARLAERRGFFAFMRSDHLLRFGGGTGVPGPTDSWVTLAGLARETSAIELGTMVSAATFRLPGPLAVAVAQVDAMSGGRVIFGLGAGWSEEEHHAYGMPFPPPRERFERLDEQLSVIRGLWTTPVGDRFSFEGTHYRLEDSPALPKPARRPHPPIVVGGNGPRRTPALAAAHADEFNFPSPLPDRAGLAAAFARVDSACEARDRDPAGLRHSLTVTVICGSEPGDLRRRGGPSGGFADVTGTPDEVAAQLAAFGDIGVERLYLRVNDLHDAEHVDLLGSEVLPQLRGA